MVSGLTVVTTTAGTIDTLATVNNTPTGKVSADLQIAAGASSLFASVNPALASTALTANMGALSMQAALLTTDSASGASIKTLTADFLGVEGDAFGTLGAISQIMGYEKFGARMDVGAAVITAAALGNDAPEVIDYMESFFASESASPFVPPTAAYGIAWNAAQSVLTSAVGAFNGLQVSSGSAFVAQAAATANACTALETPFTTLFAVSGAGAQNVTETASASGNSLAVTSGTSSVPSVTSSIIDNPDGSVGAIQSINSDGSGEIASDGQILSYTPQDITQLSYTAAGTSVISIRSNSGSGSPETFTLSNAGVVGDNTDGAALGNISVASDGSYTSSIVSPDNTASTTYNARYDRIWCMSGKSAWAWLGG